MCSSDLRERLRGRESETEEEEDRDKVSDEEESDDTAYDKRHALQSGDLP